ncbi:dual specificity protein kinase yak1 [Tulasnella sp. 419]|nr:dual specificity protein kinase yak1 [Tulasnella sp. 419]
MDADSFQDMYPPPDEHAPAQRSSTLSSSFYPSALGPTLAPYEYSPRRNPSLARRDSTRQNSQLSPRPSMDYSNPVSPDVYHQPTIQQQAPPAYHTPSLDSTRSTSGRASASTPTTPLSQRAYQPQQTQSFYSHAMDQHQQPSSQQSAPQQQQPSQLPPPQQPPQPQRRRPQGLKRVRDSRDLRPVVNAQPPGRRADPNGSGFLSPLKSLTTHITSTYNLCNPVFRYETAHNPRRVLTKPSKAAHNDGYDNEDYDYILYVNDWLGEENNNRYLILDVLGQGTFGQVVKCQNMKTHEIVAVKVVKNKPAYFNQSMMEVRILEMLNTQADPHDEHHILRLRDTFIHKNHLCLVFELLSSNLYELIKQNQFGGLSTQLVKVFTTQLLDTLSVLKEHRVIHCDLKPENILLKTLQTPGIKVIDFGSACAEGQTVYTYIQSRFYRSPEVLLGLPYNSAIDMWSLGCIAVELFLGLPLFPGTSEYNQVTRIAEMLGIPPAHMLENGKQAGNFFVAYIDEYGRKRHRLKSIEQYSAEHNVNEQPGKKYFAHNTLGEIIRNAPLNRPTKGPADIEREMQQRTAFIDFVGGLLQLDPLLRWTPQQARLHPFITGEPFTKPYTPLLAISVSATVTQVNGGVDPKRPYGGLISQQAKPNRTYDAAAYNKHLQQQQAAFNAQAANAMAASSATRNPYLAAGGQPPPSSNGQATTGAAYGYGSGQPPPSSYDHSHAHSDHYGQQQTQQARANTIHKLDQIPSSHLARWNVKHHHPHLDLEAAGMGRNLTPVLNREEAMREWERRQQGGPGASKLGAGSGGSGTPGGTYPQLEYLQQQVEMAASGLGGSSGNWSGSGGQNPAPSRYAPTQSSGLSHFQTPPAAVLTDSHHGHSGSSTGHSLGHSHSLSQDKNATLREVAMNSVRTAAGLMASNSNGRYDANGGSAASGVNVSGPAPPQPTYSGVPTSSSRTTYMSPSSSAPGSGTQPTSAPSSAVAPNYPEQSQQPPSQHASTPFDAFDHKDGLATLYAPLQPTQYQTAYGSTHPPAGPPSNQQPASGAPSFYGAAVASATGQGPPVQYPANGANNGNIAYQSPPMNNPPGTQPAFGTTASVKEARRMSGMDVWQR